MNAVILSQEILLSIKKRIPAEILIEELSKKSLQKLSEELEDENSRKTFWINLYNGFTQLSIRLQHPDFSSLKSRIFFSAGDISLFQVIFFPLTTSSMEC